MSEALQIEIFSPTSPIHSILMFLLLLLKNPFQHSKFIIDCVILSISSAIGQLFIFYTIAHFGPVVFTIIMTLRQVKPSNLHSSIWIRFVHFAHRFDLFIQCFRPLQYCYRALFTSTTFRLLEFSELSLYFWRYFCVSIVLNDCVCCDANWILANDRCWLAQALEVAVAVVATTAAAAAAAVVAVRLPKQ